MDEKRVFAILGIGSTKEEAAIRGAYRQKLRFVNPEDDPEGFKQLREAYETALKLAAQKECEAEKADNSISGQFVKKAEALYFSLQGRQDAEAWSALFAAPEFMDLEEGDACRDKLLVFLMKHCYFPTQVWKALEEGLQIVADKDRLYEVYPRDFIDFVVRKVKNGEDFEFEQLAGADAADLDGWIILFSKAGREENEKNFNAMEQTIQEAEEKGLSHPALSFMKARLLCEKGREKEGDAIVEALLAGPFAGELNVQYQAAEFFWEGGDKERSAGLYQAIKEDNRRHYMANRRLAEWYLRKLDYEAAKKCVNVLLSYPLDDDGKKLVDEINDGLMERFTKRVQEQPNDLKVRMDLGWCLLQEEHPEEVLKLMENQEPAPELEKDYVNLMSKVYFYAKKYEASVPMIRRWQRLLKEQMPTEESLMLEDMERLATAHSMLAQIDVEQAKKAEGTARDTLFAAAIEELEEAKKAHYNAGHDYAQAQAYLEWGRYEECIRICNELRVQYPDFSAAIILHQKASAKRYDADGVIGDYFALRQIAPEYMESWEMAAEVYHQLKRTEDLDHLLQDAEDGGRLTGRLKKYRFWRMVDESKKRNELLDALEYAGKIKDDWEKEEWSEQEKAELLSERARNYWRIEAYETALQLIDDAISRDAENLMYTYIKAGIKKDQKKYEEAYRLYLACSSEYDETPHFYTNVGECLYNLADYDEALPYLKKAVSLREDNPLCCDWIVRILKMQMEKADNLEKMDEAMQYANLMVEYRPESYFYVQRGLLYTMQRDYSGAAQDFQEAVRCDEGNPFAHSNLARMYRLMDRLPEALEQAERAVECMDADPSVYHYHMLGHVQWQMHHYNEALAAFLESWKRFPDRRESMLYDILELYELIGDWQAAMKLLQDFYGGKGMAFARKAVHLYCGVQLYEQASRFVERSYRKEGFSAGQTEEALAKIYWYQGNLKKASRHILRALKGCDRENVRYQDLCCIAADIFFYQGKWTEAASWAKLGLAYYQEHGGYEKWLNCLNQNLMEMYRLGTLQLYAGNKKEAAKLAAEMLQRPRCLICKQNCCMDALELQAGIYFAEGKYAEAQQLYERILEETVKDKDVRMKLELVRRKG